MKFGPVVKEMLFNDIARPFCSGEQKNLGLFGRRYYDECFCEIILNLDQWLKEILFKDIFLGLADQGS